ncbi:coiled-coil domain-containing protein [Flavobacterium agrisoli]|uniref:Glutamyl-tRNA synthetase n=1 Tax=Flavobacterium agrisoli TaxID=2793066 RepID=A0A934UJJ6_9FLAO|nr:DUF4175 family protein [Flavobacterium agrisoli]MBK0369644.1 hypothetical protein [Flavobacterium agrisoli]
MGYITKYIFEVSATELIFSKLENFVKKFYTNELIKGMILFLGLGLLYLLFTLFVEYFLWLSPAFRTLLFWIFIAVEVFLAVRLILFPLFKLFKIQKGIDYEEASKIIGNHFFDVKDKLLNFLQLSKLNEHQNGSDLVLASIEQKANSLQPIPFNAAINFKENKKFVPLALIPILIFLMFYISGNNTILTQSFNRVVHYSASFAKPAPFEFVILNTSLQTEQDKDFVIRMESRGKIIPENVTIHLGDASYFMENTKPGFFEYRITKPSSTIPFHFEANEVLSNDYKLEVVAVPTIANFDMLLQFPSYLKRKSEWIKGTGNAIIPEGTTVTWKMKTAATQKIDFKANNLVSSFSKAENEFSLTKNISQNTEYQIITSNASVKNYEKLTYQLAVVKDQFPTIQITTAPDSLKLAKGYLLGQLSDDYGLSKLQVVYYEHNKPQTAKRGTLPVKHENYDRFVFSFPSNLPVQSGINYDFYFEVFDNDSPHHFKSAKSAVFSDRVATDSEVRQLQFEEQQSLLNGFSKSLTTQNKQFSELDKLDKLGKSSSGSDFKEKQKIDDFIKKQQNQDQMMKQFAEKLNQNLDKMKVDKKDENLESLQKRLDNTEKEIEKNQKLLDELKELNTKMNNENLFEKLESFKQHSKNQSKSLEQLVELTKRYYVQQKAKQLSDELQKLANQQEKLTNDKSPNATQKQNEINNDFNKIKEDLQNLQKDNKDLKAPLDVPKSDSKAEDIKSDLEKASSNLQKNNASSAKQNQQAASKKMKALSKELQEGMSGGEQEQLEEDVAMLRQILDNLIAYSFSQEDIMLQFKKIKLGSSAYNKNIKVQQNLKQQFKHIDDSLFALSLRNPKVGEEVTKEIGNVLYNVDNALSTLTEVQVPKGIAHQQYAVAASNRLADFLSDVLNQMQMQMSGSGEGTPQNKPGQSGMQLPDIIKKQQGIGAQLQDGMKKSGQEGKQGEGNKSKSGQSQKDGEGNDGEGNAKELFEIYKEQVQLREALQKELLKNGLNPNGNNAVNQMKQLEKELLNKGFRNENLRRTLQIQQELLKLENAVQQQGEDAKRESNTNKSNFTNPSKALPSSLLDYLNSIEILNRQSLPLQPNFNKKVQEYFNKNGQL